MSRKLVKSTLATGGMTLLSRLTGLLRDMVLAHMVGAGLMADVFFVAFRIPNFFRRVSGEGAFSQAFVPVFSEYRDQRSPEETQTFLNNMSGWFGGILLVAAFAGIIGAPLLVGLVAPGFIQQADKFALTVDTLRITFPYLFFISLVAMAGGVLNACGRFAVPAATPILLNLCLIGAAIFLIPMTTAPAIALGVGVLVAGIVQLLFQLPFLSREGILPHPRMRRRDPGVARVFRLMVPAVFASSVSQINILVSTALASGLVTGSISWLFYSDRVMEFPLGVFGIALATVILPTLSRLHARSDHETFARVLDWALRWVALIATPAAIGLILLAGPIMTTLFLHGVMTVDDVRMSARSLVAFAAGLGGLILVKVLVPGFFARQDTKTPVRAAVIGVSVNIVLGVLLVTPLAHVGLATALSVAAWVQAGVLFYILRQRGIIVLQAGWARLLRQIAVAGSVMAGVLVFGVPGLDAWISAHGWQRLFWLILSIIVGAASYFLVILAQGVRPHQLFLKREDL